MSDKLEAKYDKCLFVGYQFYNPLEQKVFVSKHVVFLEKENLLRGDTGSKVELEEVQRAQTDAYQLTETVIREDGVIVEPSEAQALCRPSMIHIVPERYGFLISE